MHLSAFSKSVLFLLGMIFYASQGVCAPHPSWWADAEDEARHDGYRLVDEKELLQVLEKSENALLLDVRAEYEFEQGHIAEALNIEFDLGEQQRLVQEKKDRFMALAGADFDRPIIIYCRSFR